MDVRKTYKADLERRRLSGFLLGLIVALSMCVVALEYTTRDDSSTADRDKLDDLSEDIESMPLIHRKDMVAAVAPQDRNRILERVKPVETETDVAVDESVKTDEDVDAAKKGNGVNVAGNERQSETERQTTALSPVAVDENDNPLDLRVVEALPEFPGGMVEFMKWLTKTLKYPVLAQQQKIQGRVLVSFIINKDGTLSDAKIVASVSPELDREALRVVRMMPKWKAGEYHGKPCRTYFRIPIVFKL